MTKALVQGEGAEIIAGVSDHTEVTGEGRYIGSATSEQYNLLWVSSVGTGFPAEVVGSLSTFNGKVTSCTSTNGTP